MAQEQVGPSEVLMVGDGHSDRQAAEYTGCDFIYVPPGASLPALLRQALGEQLSISS
jgi:phosphoglycolate phosphatase-like HAD superfamily hydrolase